MKLLIFLAHLDDFELSCLGYVFKNYKRYKSIDLIVGAYNNFKDKVTKENIQGLNDKYKIKVNYFNLGYKASSFFENLDKIKKDFYGNYVNFKKGFDILTHNQEDHHTDHIALNMISNGLFKFSDRFITCYSPSTLNFKPNYFIEMNDEEYSFKHDANSKYDIEKDDSFSKLGYYFSEHWDIGAVYNMEYNVKVNQKHCEIYKILKWK